MGERELLVRVGKRIKTIRVEKKMSQQDLATACDFEKASMSRIESGKANPTLLTLRKISSALDIPISELFHN